MDSHWLPESALSALVVGVASRFITTDLERLEQKPEVRMQGFFSSDPFTDSTLGELRRQGGKWTCQLALPPHGVVEMRVAGDRKRPDDASLKKAVALPAEYAALRAQVASALYEHFQPGLEAWRAGELEGMVETFPELKSAEEVWGHVRVEYVDIDAAQRGFSVEIRFEAAWDEEHTLGVRLADGRVVELCGSVGP